MFRVTSRLLDCRITLFTRVNCSLCDAAKSVVGNVRERRPFTYHEIDVMQPGQEKWKSVYEFDTPVVCLPIYFISSCYASAESSDPCRQSQFSRDNDVGAQINASIQGGSSDEVDGRGRAIVAVFIS